MKPRKMSMHHRDIVQGKPAWLPVELLNAADVRFMKGLRGKIRVEERNGAVWVYTRAWAGTLRLSQIRLDVRPKIHPERWARALFYMMDVAESPDAFLYDKVAKYGAGTAVLHALVRRFLGAAEEIVSHGLRREYQPEEHRRRVMRGRLILREMIKPNFDGRLPCRSFDLAPDVPENQLIKSALGVVMRLGLPPELSGRTARIHAAFEDISEVVPRGIQYHRLNERYRESHRLAHSILKALYPAYEAGPVPFASFLVNMEGLFEQFIRRILKRILGERFEVASSRRLLRGAAGNRVSTIALEPDILVRERLGRRPVLVLDTKYKTPTTAGRYGRSRARNADFYQIYAYANAYRCPGVLIYPQHDFSEAPIRDRFATPGQLTALYTVDLAQPPEMIGKALANAVFGLIAEATGVATNAPQPNVP